MNNVIILGAGALGSVLGALLSKNTNNKVLLIGNKQHVAIIKKHTLIVQGMIDEKFAISAEHHLQSIPEHTIIFLMVKCNDIIPTLKNIKQLLRKDTILVCLSNGLEIKELVLKEIGNACVVIRGVSYLACTFLEPGKVFYTGGTLTELEKTSYDQQLYDLFDNTNLNLKTYEYFKKQEFRKAILNATLNPLSALFNCPTRVLAEERYSNLITQLILECITIAEKEQVQFDENLVSTFSKIFRGSSNKKSSMLQDIERGRKTEIDFINGKFVELAKKHHLQAPLNRALVTLIKALETKNE